MATIGPVLELVHQLQTSGFNRDPDTHMVIVSPVPDLTALLGMDVVPGECWGVRIDILTKEQL